MYIPCMRKNRPCMFPGRFKIELCMHCPGRVKHTILQVGSKPIQVGLKSNRGDVHIPGANSETTTWTQTHTPRLDKVILKGQDEVATAQWNLVEHAVQPEGGGIPPEFEP